MSGFSNVTVVALERLRIPGVSGITYNLTFR